MDFFRHICLRRGPMLGRQWWQWQWRWRWRHASLCLVLTACGARTGLPGFLQNDAGPTPRAPEMTAIPPSKFQARADKIDLLFVIDDSGSMQDKQTILSRAVPDLVDRLVNPLCVDPGTLSPVPDQPSSALSACPTGSLREFNSVQDLHIGVVSTSLGGMGASSCGVGIAVSSANGRGRLVPPRPAGTSGTESGNFLAWHPGQAGTSPEDRDPATLRNGVRNLIALGEQGCPYEMPFEAMYRFLVDPEPYLNLSIATCAASAGSESCAVEDGTDEELLQERASFLRYDSLVAVVVLTDENDCSLTAGGQSFHVFDSPGTVPRATSQCATDPNDRCCRSCAASPPDGCPENAVDGECEKGPYPATEDSGLLRCFEQKRRLGADYLYPVSRYVDGLTGHRVPKRNGALVDNPLFHDPRGLQPPRDPSLVFAAAIIGVPWQDIAVDPSNVTDLEFKSPEQMDADGTWSLILGDPDHGALPRDPLMIESTDERTGVQPILRVPLMPSSSLNPLANPINGHETALGPAPTDLQYACIFDLPAPESSFDCPGFSGSDRAICQAADGSYGSTQFRAKAYPGLRELSVLKGVGKNAIVASICSRNVTSEDREDYGYRPALRQILDRLRVGLN